MDMVILVLVIVCTGLLGFVLMGLAIAGVIMFADRKRWDVNETEERE